MSYTGRIENGSVVFDPPISLPNGTIVEVTVQEDPNSPATHYDYYKEIIGAAEGLPEDFAENHDHYIHGTPKR